jgi:hypothetical protein
MTYEFFNEKYQIIFEQAIEIVKKHYKDKYYSSGLVPDNVEIIQRHPEIISAIITQIARDKEQEIEEFRKKMRSKDGFE